jgi:hypothetical protein
MHAEHFTIHLLGLHWHRFCLTINCFLTPDGPVFVEPVLCLRVCSTSFGILQLHSRPLAKIAGTLHDIDM